MRMTLSENIRAQRKSRGLTQEQFAEVMGVTTGAVYKWEAGLSVPELELIVEMADFFDLSVDALLGYRMKDNRLDALMERLSACCQTMDSAALTEAEKALGKYPHSFRVVYTCATVYLAYGSSRHDAQLLRRALTLLDQARVLLPQNDDPRISEATLTGHMSVAYFHLGEREKAVDLMKRNNAGGLFSEQIGLSLAAFMDRPEEAVPFLSEAMLSGLSNLINAALGYVFVYRARGDWASALAIAALVNDLVSQMKGEGPAGFLDKVRVEMLLILAYARLKTGQKDDAREALRQAAALAVRFDSTPAYGLSSVRFLEDADNASGYDALGDSAAGSVEYLLRLLQDPELTELWEEVQPHA